MVTARVGAQATTPSAAGHPRSGEPAESTPVIIGVGEPVFDQGDALVPVSLWCGGLCGTWLTCRVVLADGGWTVTGIEGSIAIS